MNTVLKLFTLFFLVVFVLSTEEDNLKLLEQSTNQSKAEGKNLRGLDCAGWVCGVTEHCCPGYNLVCIGGFCTPN